MNLLLRGLTTHPKSPQDFLACMREQRGSHIDCKHLSKSYLQCRMDKCVGVDYTHFPFHNPLLVD